MARDITQIQRSCIDDNGVNDKMKSLGLRSDSKLEIQYVASFLVDGLPKSSRGACKSSCEFLIIQFARNPITCSKFF